MRKDVECTFGILKKRFKCLDNGIDVGSIEKADMVFLTCCALHNYILKIDEMDKEWDGEVSMGDSDNDNFVMSRLGHVEAETTDEDDLNNCEYVADNRITIVREMNLEVFKQRLITHFDILFQRRKIVWPKQIKQRPQKY